MKINNYIRARVIHLSLIGIIFFSLSSCIIYRDATTHEDDGIYDSSEPKREVAVRNEVEEQDTNSKAYQDYFKREADRYEEITEDDIFTDVDSLGYGDDEYYDEEYIDGNSPWEYTDNVSVNFNFGWGGFYRPWYNYGFYNSFYNPYYGYGGYYNPFYYNSFYWPYVGYDALYYGYGYGYGGFYNPYYRYGYGYYHPYYRYNRYNSNYSYGRRYAYNTSRLGNRSAFIRR